MQALPPPTIELSDREYRTAIYHGWRRWLYFARHPILAIVAYQTAYPDEPKPKAVADRQNTLLGTAMVHGFVAWLLLHR